MKCKNCGGELYFQSGTCLCKSCGATFTLDSIYENVDVYICYEENDGAGRRTKDSIVAQEVYRKLEEGKIATFYERVSADGMASDDLHASKLVAIHKAKAILVIGTSVENFKACEEKYGKYFTDKPVIPFCVDVNPSAIPKTLSQIQAMSYSTIGWDKDLIKGVNNILGREQTVDTDSLYGRRKTKIIVGATITVAAIIIATVSAWFCFRAGGKNENPGDVQLDETIETTVKPLTQREIYENAQEILNGGKYLEAATEFNKILDYKDSSNQIKKIYDRYDGYYQDEGKIYSLYINVIEGKTVEFSFTKTIENRVVKIEDSLVIENNIISGNYIDSLLNEGHVSITINNDFVNLSISTNVSNNKVCFGNAEIKFHLKDKTDRPSIRTVTKELLLNWMNSLTYIDDIKAFGYELEYIEEEGEIDDSYGTRYKIVNTDIILVTTDEDLTKFTGQSLDNPSTLEGKAVVAIIAPTSLVCPDKIGQNACVFSKDQVAYVPNATNISSFYSSNKQDFLNFEIDSISQISNTMDTRTMCELLIQNNSTIGITSKKIIGEYNYNLIIDENTKVYYRTLALQQYKKDNPSITGTHIYPRIVAENGKALLINIHVDGSFNYYRMNLSTEECTFIMKNREVSYVNQYGSREYSYDEWKEHPEFFGEFLVE